MLHRLHHTAFPSFTVHVSTECPVCEQYLHLLFGLLLVASTLDILDLITEYQGLVSGIGIFCFGNKTKREYFFIFQKILRRDYLITNKTIIITILIRDNNIKFKPNMFSSLQQLPSSLQYSMNGNFRIGNGLIND
jgi:hypothetical protein